MSGASSFAPLLLSLALLAISASDNSRAESYDFTTIAGEAGYGEEDGPGNVARFHAPSGLVVDASGDLVVADSFNHTLRKVTPAGVVSTFVGEAEVAGKADGISALARLNAPAGVVRDSHGNLFVADAGNQRIRKVTPQGEVITFAGGTPGILDGLGTAARFSSPGGIAIDAADNLYVTDDSTIRLITPDGQVTTIAGKASTSGSVNGVGAAARFNFPSGLGLDALGNLFICDTSNQTIRKMTPDRTVSTFAGKAANSGTVDGVGGAARFSAPRGLALDPLGNIYVADLGNHTIRKIAPDATVTTVAGLAEKPGVADGPGSDARFVRPTGIALDSSGNIFVTTANNSIRKITPAFLVSTLAGRVAAFGLAPGIDGTGNLARFYWPQGLKIGSSGDAYLADRGNHTIRRITPDGVVTTLAGKATLSGTSDGMGPGARFNAPGDLALDAQDNVYVADTSNYTIRKITPEGLVTTYAGKALTSGNTDGTLTTARFNGPTGLAFDATENLFVAAGSLRKITPDGVVSTVAKASGAVSVTVDGTGNVYFIDGLVVRKLDTNGVVKLLAGGQRGSRDGQGAAAQFDFPWGIAADSAGDVFVADTSNHTIRKITPGGLVSTVAGSAGIYSDRDGIASRARFDSPWGIAVDKLGNLFVSDYGNSFGDYTVKKGSPARALIATELLPGNHLRLSFRYRDGSAPPDVTKLEVQRRTDLPNNGDQSWESVTSGIFSSDGVVGWDDSDAVSSAHQFYRLVEH